MDDRVETRTVGARLRIEREDRQADRPEQKVESDGGDASTKAKQGATEKDAERLQRHRHERVAWQVEADPGADDDEQRADRDHEHVALPRRGPLADANRNEEVAERDASL